MITCSVNRTGLLAIIVGVSACSPYSGNVPQQRAPVQVNVPPVVLPSMPPAAEASGGPYQVPRPFGSGWQNLRCREGSLAVRSVGPDVMINYQGREAQLKFEPSRSPLIYQNAAFQLYLQGNEALLTDGRANPLLSACR